MSETAFIALLRAINVGGTGKLPMSELRALCEESGFSDVKTYIQSGNVVFRSKLDEARVTKKLEKALAAKLGKPYGVMVRTLRELDKVIEKNPFPKAAPNRLLVVFMPNSVSKSALADVKNAKDGEEVRLAGREAYVHYPNGMGRSKLQVPFAKTGTGRNLNTVKKLAEMARAATEASA
jgi:uncharacterized protein (DUF1697 family)